MNPYNYCTRCGSELTDDVKERYAEEHSGGPILCRACIVEVVQGIPKAIQSMFVAVNDAFESAFNVEGSDE